MSDGLERLTLDDLEAMVVPRDPARIPAAKSAAESRAKEEGALSGAARQFIEAAMANEGLHLEALWEIVGVTAGSKKASVLKELRSYGFVRLERKGKFRRVKVLPAAYEYVGSPVPKGRGSGGALHQSMVARLAADFRKKGYECHIEFPLGPSRRRVDLYAIGASTRIAVEVGLSRPEQEVKNIREDIESGAVDSVLFVAATPEFLGRVRARCVNDPALRGHAARIGFHLMDEERCGPSAGA